MAHHPTFPDAAEIRHYHNSNPDIKAPNSWLHGQGMPLEYVEALFEHVPKIIGLIATLLPLIPIICVLGCCWVHKRKLCPKDDNEREETNKQIPVGSNNNTNIYKAPPQPSHQTPRNPTCPPMNDQRSAGQSTTINISNNNENVGPPKPRSPEA
jgi:hypothetical protein